MAANLEVKNYLLNRGINEETIKTFQIGFAPKGWDNLSTFFKKNLDPELQKVDAGLFKISEKIISFMTFSEIELFFLSNLIEIKLLDLVEE